MLYVEFSESSSLHLCDKRALFKRSAACRIHQGAEDAPPSTHSRYTPRLLQEQEMSTERAQQRRRIAFCFPLLEKPFQCPPTRVYKNLFAEQTEEHKKLLFSPQLSSSRALSRCLQRRSLSEKMPLNNWAKLCPLGAFAQTVPGRTKAEVAGSLSTKELRPRSSAQSSPPPTSGRNQVVDKRDSP